MKKKNYKRKLMSMKNPTYSREISEGSLESKITKRKRKKEKKRKNTALVSG